MLHGDADVELRLMILRCSKAICGAVLLASGYELDADQVSALVDGLHFPAEQDDD